jgi:hypothetical protein
MAFHIELRVNLVKTLQVPIFYSLIYAHFGDGPIIFKTINYVVSVYCV